MKIKICPYCDCEMTKSHYCDSCRSFVLKPDIIDIHFNAETRGLGEVDCAYGEEHDEKDHQVKDIWKTVRKPENSAKEKMPAGKAHTDQGKKPEEKSNGGCLTLIIFFVLIMVIARSFAGIFGAVFDGSDILDIFGDAEDFFEYSEETVNPDDYPDGCTVSEHFATTFDTADMAVVMWLNKKYPDETVIEDYFEDDYVSGNDVVLNAEAEYTFDDGSDLCVYVDYDSATGQLHSVSMYNAGYDEADSFVNMILKLFEEEEGYTYDKFDSEAASDDGAGEIYVETGNVSIAGSVEDDMIDFIDIEVIPQ